MAKANEAKQFEAAIEPVVAFNKLVVKNAESALKLQFASLQALTNMGIKNLNAGLEVRTADDFKAYAEKQKDVAREVTERVTADAKAFGELNAEFISDTRALAEKNMKAAAETAKAA